MSVLPEKKVAPERGSGKPLRVWVDRGACQGAELCVEAAGAVFATDGDYVSFIRLAGDGEPADTAEYAAAVPAEHEDGVRLAAEECPSRCIHLIDRRSPLSPASAEELT